MAVKRLQEIYDIGSAVEILLPGSALAGEEQMQWIAGHVVAHDFPGIWVQTDDDHLWFVTNARKICLRPSTGSPPAAPH